MLLSFRKISTAVLALFSVVVALLFVAWYSPAGAQLAPGGSYLPLVFNAWPTPQPARLLLTEVLPDPNGPEPGGEWIEVYNAGGSPADLSVVKLGDEETQGEQEGMFAFPPGTMLQPGETLVIAGQAVVFYGLFGQQPDFELRESDPTVADMLRYTAWAGGSLELGNSGDEVLLLNAYDEVLDALSWGASRFAFDPTVKSPTGGHSLERFPASQDTDAASDWREQEQPSPGSVSAALPAPTPTGATAIPPGTATPLPPFALVFNEIHADPDPNAGDANGDGSISTTGDEFVEIVNSLSEELDLSGWSILDAVERRHVFPPGSRLPGGCALVVFGGGEPVGRFGGSLVQTASTGRLLLNNSGDTLSLLDLTGTTVITYTYGGEGGENQSLTRAPDVTGPEPFVRHTTVEAAQGVRFSPGTRLDGSVFSGCPAPAATISP